MSKRVRSLHRHSGPSSSDPLPDGRTLTTWRCKCGKVQCKLDSQTPPAGWGVFDDPRQMKMAFTTGGR